MSTRHKTPAAIADTVDCSDDRTGVAECEQAESTLQFMQFTLDHFSDAVIWTRRDGQINYVNNSACSLLGCARPDLVAKTMLDIAPGFSTASWADHFQVTREQVSRVFEGTLITSEDRVVRVKMAAHYMAFRGQEYNCFLIQNLANQYNATQNAQKLSEVTERTASLMEEIEGREKIESMLLDEAEQIQNILDNVGQGFLTFGQTQKIDLQCSQECRVMFNGEVWGYLFPEVLYPNDENKRAFLTSLLQSIFIETDRDKQDVFFSLLPAEVSLSGNRFIEVEYRLIDGAGDRGHKMMTILTDVTETRRLREQVGEEKRLLKMVVRAVVQYEELVESISDYEDFCSLLREQILRGPGSADEKLHEIFRRIHTFKGTFGQLDLMHVVAELDGMETRLSRLREDTKFSGIAMIEKLLDDSNMGTWLDKDIRILKDTLGESFLDCEPAIEVKPSQITEIEGEMTRLLTPGELRRLLPMMKRLRNRSFKKLLRSYPEYVERLSGRLQKSIKPMAIEGDDISVNPEQYGDFCKALVHVFRNAVDHGIESVEERQERGKDESAQIQCRIRVGGGVLSLEISDDGAGIDVQRVKQKALAKGICELDAAEAMSDEELLELIFEDNLSTRDTPTEYSGRGVGLPAIREELNRLGGKVEVRTRVGEGTAFRFSIPVAEACEVPKISIERVMDIIIDRAQFYMTEEMSLTIDSERSQSKMRTDLLQLDGVISLISLKGALSAVFAMGVDNGLARYLVQQFAVGELTEGEVAEYLGDTMSEIANIVTGSTLNVLPKTNSMITIGTPTTCTTDDASHLRFAGPEMWTAVIQTDRGKLSVSLLMSEGN